jgi:uncharacterized membrane protein (UPF0182 family)
MESSLDQALTKLFGELKGDKKPTTPETPDKPGTPDTPGISDPLIETNLQDLVTKINEVFLNQEQAAREGRWADYGNYGNQLKELLNNLVELVE